MSDADSVTIWIGRLKDGDQDAVRRLWDRYFAQLVRLANFKMRGLSRTAVDDEDVALSAFGSFCRAVGKGSLRQLESRDDLWQILVSMTTRKSIDQRRRQQALRRGGPDVLAATLNDEIVLESLLGRDPDPQFSALVAEEFQSLLDRLKDEQMRDIALGKLEGYTNQEIADHLGCSLRTVERRLDMIRKAWDDLGAEA